MDAKLLVLKFCDYSKYIKGYSPATLRRYRAVTNNYFKFANISEIEEVTEDNVRNLFFYGRTTKNWGQNTFIQYHKTLGVFFRWCIKEGCLKINPIGDLETPKLPKRLPPKLTKQDAMRLLEVVYNYPYKYKFLRYRNQAIFATFLYSGIRKKELLSLKLTDVDLENLSIFIRQGKGSKDRVVPISFRLAEILKKYLTERQRLRKTCPEFFTSLNRNVGFTESGLKRLVDHHKIFEPPI